MERKKKWIVLLLSFHILIFNCAVARAEALPEFLSATSTVADAVMSYYASVGAGISNLEWINTLNSSLGESFGTVESFINQGYLILNDAGQWTATQAFTTAIENTSAYASLGLNEMFNVSAEEVAAGGGAAVASGGAILAGSMGSLASTGVIPLFAGVSASYWAGIGLGTLAAHALGLYEKPVTYGLDILTSDGYLNSIPAGGLAFYRRKFNTSVASYEFLSASSGLIGYAYPLSTAGRYSTNFYNPNDGVTRYYNVYNPDTQTNQKRSVSPGNVGTSQTVYHDDPDGFQLLDRNYTVAELNKLYEDGDLKNKTRYSPDIIGPNGNQQGSYDPESQKYTVPDFLPQIDPTREALSPVSMTDWLNFANGANTNTNTGAYPDNGGLFDNMLDAIKGLIPEPAPTPLPTPTPTPVPDPDYGDPNPEQPDYEDQTETPPDPVDTGAPWLLPDLKEKFPFCIPWDIGKIFGKFNSSSRQAPYIHWRFHPNEDIDYTFNLDLEDFEEVAELLRMLELGAFIVGLAFATRYMIGAN